VAAAPTSREFLDPTVLARLGRLELIARGPMEGSVSGRHKSPHRGSSVEFAEYREYVPGDDPRHMDWRVLARSDRYYLKEFEADTNLRCYLVVDNSGSMGFAGEGSQSKLAYARRLAATLAYLAVHQGDAVGLTCCAQDLNKEIPPRRTPSHLRNIFDTLAEVQSSGPTGLIASLHALAEKIKRRALVVVISDLFCDPDQLLSCFQHLRYRKHDLAVFHLLDRTEVDFTFDRPIRFVDMEGSDNVIAEPALIMPRYRDALEKYLARLRKGCREFKADYRMVLTDQSYEKVLADFLLARMK
jgi:uncharacterized protein (DUF58 family)